MSVNCPGLIYLSTWLLADNIRLWARSGIQRNDGMTHQVESEDTSVMSNK